MSKKLQKKKKKNTDIHDPVYLRAIKGLRENWNKEDEMGIKGH